MIQHPNIVRFLGVHFEGNSNIPMLVMEFIPTSLRKHVEKNGPLGDNRTRILLDVAQGLFYLHGLDPPLIHRNLTSSNILLTTDLHAKITDLGTLDHQPYQLLTNNLSHMPPEALVEGEQAYRQSTDKAKKLDVFSFGNILINVMTGEFPMVDLRNRHITEVQRRQHLLVKIANCKEKDLIVHCLNKNPDDRLTTTQLVEFFKGTPLKEG